MTASQFAGWMILELMGHRKLAGFISEVQIAGAPFLRIDVPSPDPNEEGATQFYSSQAIYAITPSTEDFCLRVAKQLQPRPIDTWELPLLDQKQETRREDDWDEGPEER